MKTLFIGGVKSGKSRLAEDHILANTKGLKPIYLATNECFDEEMQRRVSQHQMRRGTLFTTVEEPLQLLAALRQHSGPALVECITMWLNNCLYHQVVENKILAELEAVLQLPNTLVLVHNEVGFGIIPDNPLARQFADLSGKAAQLMGVYCEQVYFCSAGLKLSMKHNLSS
ncbi:MAG: bifunctional adenosylcobinamide kinase/adenosylcobinamide-phosphate guanylyltransferase [Methylococcales bacterium]